MRTVIVAAIALVFGLIIGSLGPREELREAQARITELEAKVTSKGRRSGLAQGLLKLPRSDDRRYDRDRAPEEPPREIAPIAGAEAEVEGTPREKQDEKEGGTPEDEPMNKGERLEQARTALELRRTQARAALMERANLSDEQLKGFDATVSRMNEGLEVIAEDMAEYIQSGKEPSRREAMHLASDVLDVLLEADNGFGALMTEDQYNNAGEDAVDPLSYIDPNLVDFLQEL